MVSLGKAELQDALFVRHVRNEPRIRSRSGNCGQIGLIEHLRWWWRRSREREAVLIVREGRSRAGYARIMRPKDGVSDVSIALLPEFQGRGIGRKALWLALRVSRFTPGLASWRAVIQASNVASLRTFESVGFTPLGQSSVGGELWVVMKLAREDLERGTGPDKDT